MQMYPSGWALISILMTMYNSWYQSSPVGQWRPWSKAWSQAGTTCDMWIHVLCSLQITFHRKPPLYNCGKIIEHQSLSYCAFMFPYRRSLWLLKWRHFKILNFDWVYSNFLSNCIIHLINHTDRSHCPAEFLTQPDSLSLQYFEGQV